MQILRLLTARRFRGSRRRRAVSTITATAPCTPCGHFYGEEEDEGPFFDLDLTCRSAPASSAGSQATESGSESDDSCCAHASSAAVVAGDLDFVISLQRGRSASPSLYKERLFFRGVAQPPPPPLKFCASEPIDVASRRYSTGASRRGSSRVPLRTLSFGSAKAAFYGGRASFSRSSSSARSATLFAAANGGYGSPDQEVQDHEARARSPSGDVFRRYLSKISSRLRRVAVAPDSRLRKSRSASAAQMAAAASQSSPLPRRDDALVEKQDGIASAIAHCKESLQRASISECNTDTSLLRSRSDPIGTVTTP